MIVAPGESGWRCITQPDHARLSRRILELWRRDPLPSHPRRRELLFATGEHDNGWQEADSAPRLAPTADRPVDFATHPPSERYEIWRRGIDRHSRRSPYAAALIAEHAGFLHSLDGEDDELEGFVGEVRARRDELATQAGLELATLTADYRWLHLADLLSLVACTQWPDRFERWGFDIRWIDDRLAVSPFPLAGVTTFAVAGRRLPKRSYKGDSDLAGELAAATWQEFIFKLGPGS